jgi:gas vesicle protein
VTSARSTRSSLIIGGLIGLLLGTLAALLWDPVVERRLRSRSA